MLLGALVLAAVVLLGATALVQRGAGRVSSDTSLAAQESLGHRGAGSGAEAERARQEMIHVVHRGMEQG